MSTKLIFICDICQKEIKYRDESLNLDNDVFGLEQGFDICKDCEDKISKAICELKEKAKLEQNN